MSTVVVIEGNVIVWIVFLHTLVFAQLRMQKNRLSDFGLIFVCSQSFAEVENLFLSELFLLIAVTADIITPVSTVPLRGSQRRN